MSISGIWFCNALMDRFVSTGGHLLERRWTDVTKIAMTAFSIIKTLDVFKDICPSLISISVANPIHSLSFHYTEEALHNRVVIAISATTHAAGHSVSLKLVSEIIARVLAAAVAMMDEIPFRPALIDCHR